MDHNNFAPIKKKNESYKTNKINSKIKDIVYRKKKFKNSNTKFEKK